MLSARPAWMFSASPMLGVASILRLLVVSPVVRNLRGLLFGGGGLGRKAEAPDGTVMEVPSILLGSPSPAGAENPRPRVMRRFSDRRQTSNSAAGYLPRMRRVALA